MTTIVTPETQRREAENIRNECKRHCRIGKVRHKLPKGWGPDPQPIFRPLPPYGVDMDGEWHRRLFGSPIDEAVRAPMTWGGGYVHPARGTRRISWLRTIAAAHGFRRPHEGQQERKPVNTAKDET